MWSCLTLNSSRDRKAQIKRPPFCLVDPADAPLAQSAIQSEPLFILGRAARAYWHVGIRPMGATAPPVTSPSSCWVALAGKSLWLLVRGSIQQKLLLLRCISELLHCTRTAISRLEDVTISICFYSASALLRIFCIMMFLNPFIVLQGITYQ